MEAVLGEGCILAPNHGSYLDWMVLGALFRYRHKRRLIFLAKDRLFRHPIFGPIMRHEQCVRVSDDGDEVLDAGGIERAKYLCIFPEGKRSRDGLLGPAHTGVVKYAVKLDLPIVPVGLKGFFDAWPPGRALPRPRRCTIVFGSPRRLPYPPGATLDSETLRAETEAIMADIAALIGRTYAVSAAAEQSTPGNTLAARC
jgi:1-acyl-sn-glycerol-3-phosphate acyltransferase